MSNKLNITSVIKGHMSTLKDSNGKDSFSDIFTFFLLPIAIAGLCLNAGVDFAKDVIEIFVTSSSIFTGLLLNLLILVYDQKTKLNIVDNKKSGWEKLQSKHTLIKELYYNISYATLISLIILITSVLHISLIEEKSIGFYSKFIDVPSFDVTRFTTTPLLIFLCINLVFTVLMVIKRIYSLLLSDVD